MAAAGDGSPSAGEGRTPAGQPLPAEDATPGTYFDWARVGSAPSPPMVHVTNARAKESLGAWRNLPILKYRILIGERPTIANLKLMEMQSLLREKVRVYRGPRAAQRHEWIPRADVHRGRRRSTHHPYHPHRAPRDVDRCRNDYPVPWDRVGRRDHAHGDAPSTVQKRNRLDRRPLPPAPQQNVGPYDV